MNSLVIDPGCKPTAYIFINCLETGFAKPRKSLTVYPEIFSLVFRRSERWIMEKLMNKSLDIQSFLVLLGECTDSGNCGYQVLLGWAGNIIRSSSAPKADTEELCDTVRGLVHSFILKKIPTISNHIQNNRGVFNKYQIARYVKVSLLNYYRSHWKLELGLEARLKREQQFQKQQQGKEQKSRSAEYDRLTELKEPGWEMPKDDLDQEFVVESLLRSRGNHVIYELMSGLPDRLKRYIFFAYSNRDPNIYPTKNPVAARKEQSLSKQALQSFITRHKLQEFEIYYFLRSLPGQIFLAELKQQFGVGNA